MRQESYSQLASRLQAHLTGRGGGLSIINIEGGGGGGSGDYLPLDGTGVMAGNLNLGGNDITNVGLVDGFDIPTLASTIHPRQHDLLNPLDHIIVGAAGQVVGLTAPNTLGLLTPTTSAVANPGALLRSPDMGGTLTLGALDVQGNITAEWFLARDISGFSWFDDAGTRVMSLPDGGGMIVGAPTVSIYPGIDVFGNSRINGNLEITGSINVDVVVGDFIYTGDGAFVTPSLSFQDDQDLGVYRSAPNEMTFVANASIIAVLSASRIHLTKNTEVPTLIATGDAEFLTNLTLSSAGNHGIHFNGGGKIRGSIAGLIELFDADLDITTGALKMGVSDSVVIGSDRRIYPVVGSAVLPGLAFSGDTDTGLYRPDFDQLAIATGGVQRLLVSNTATTIANDLSIGGRTFFAAGSAALPGLAVAGDTDTGLFGAVGSNRLSVATGGVQRLDVTDTTTTVYNALAVTGNIDVGGNFVNPLSIALTAPGVPFILNANAQGQTVIGLRSDQLNKSLTAGDGLAGGGLLTESRSVSVNQGYAFTWTVPHGYVLASTQPPFILNANAQGQTVIGLRSDQLNKSLTAGDGLAGGGLLTESRSLAVDATVARRNAANTFAGDQTIQKALPALHLDTTVEVWSVLGSAASLDFDLDGNTKFSITATGAISISGGLTVDIDTLVVDAANDAAWVNSGSPDGDVAFKVSSVASDDVVAVFRAAPSQTAYIWTVADSSNNDLLGIDAAGNLQSLSTGFVSGRSGWRISADGNAEFNNLVARGEIRTALFTKDEIRVDSGSHLFAEAGRTRAAFTSGPGSLNLDIQDPPYEHTAVFAVGDNLLIRSGGERDYNESTGPNIPAPWTFYHPRLPQAAAGLLIAGEVWLQVTAVTDMTDFYRYTVVKQAGPTMAFPENTTVVSYGNGASGLMGIFADQGVGPYLDVFLPSATPWATIAQTPIRLGRLDGLGLPELATEQYGIAISTDLTDTTAGRIIASDQQFLIKNIDFSIANNGKTVFDVNNQGVFYMGTDANSPLNTSQISYNAFDVGAIVIGNPNGTAIARTGGGESFAMTGNFGLFPANDGINPDYGRFFANVPILLRYSSIYDVNGGIFGGSGTFDQPTAGIKWWMTSSSATKLAGYVNSAERWSVGTDGKWTFADGQVQINDFGIELTATDATVDDPANNLYWRLGNDVIGAVSGYREFDGSRVIRFAAIHEEPDAALLRLDARSGGTEESPLGTNAYLSLYADDGVGSTEIFLSAEEVVFAQSARVRNQLLLEPIAEPTADATAVILYHDSATGYLRAKFPNGVRKNITTNV